MTVRAFDGYARQRNAAMRLPFRHRWVLVLDADERPTPEFSAEMQAAVTAAPETVAGFRMRRRAYSTKEAELLASGDAIRDASWRQALFASNFHERRVAQKAIFCEMPGRPLVKWLYMMFVRGSILDGRPGVTYATLHAFYEYLIETKRREILRLQSGKTL